MREIKFRAWDEEDNEMNYYPIVYPIVHDGKWYDSFISFDADETRSGTLMQYTGLKDKNGKEIYEGDIVADGDGDFIEVEWNFQLLHYLSECESEPLEVIGNIYEHSYLLDK